MVIHFCNDLSGSVVSVPMSHSDSRSKWDVEFRCGDSCVLLDADLYAKERKVGGWSVLGDSFVRWCGTLRKAQEEQQVAADRAASAAV